MPILNPFILHHVQNQANNNNNNNNSKNNDNNNNDYNKYDKIPWRRFLHIKGVSIVLFKLFNE